MKLHTIDRIQTLPVPLDQAWEYFSNPCNLQGITPHWLDFRIVSCEHGRMYAGMVIAYTIRILPFVRTPWVTEITRVNEPVFFVDEQRLGPYRFWHHQHHFRRVEGGVRMRDLVHYALPYGPLGTLAHSLWIRKRLQSIFDYRRERLDQMFDEGAGHQPHELSSWAD